MGLIAYCRGRLICLSVLIIVSSTEGSAQQLTSVSNSERAVAPELRLNGCPVFAIDAAELPAQETGLLAKMSLKPGDELAGQQLLAQIDDSSTQMEKSVAAVEARLARELADDQTDILFAAAVLEEAKIALKSYEEIERRGSASSAEIRNKQLAVEQAELKLQHAKLAQKQLLVRAELALKGMESAEQRLKKFRILTPFSGTITSVSKREGEWVQVGQSVASIVRLEELRVDAFVSIQNYHPSGLVGRSVWVDMPLELGHANDIRFAGKITHFDPDVTSAGQVRIHATVQNARKNGHWQLLPGMQVSMQVLP